MKNTAIKNGILMSLGFIVYMILMRALGLIHIVELRVLNFLILIGFVWNAINTEKNKADREFKYVSGFETGMLTTAIGIIPFTLFLFVYLTAIEPTFLPEVVQSQSLGRYLNEFTAPGVILVEGLASGFLATYAVMQYMKAHTPKVNG